MLLQYHNAQIHLFEFSLDERNYEDVTSAAKKTSAYSPGRLKALTACFDACLKFFDTYFRLDASASFTMSGLESCCFAHALSTSIRLALVEVSGWDYNTVRHNFDISEILEQAARRYDLAASVMLITGTTRMDHFSLLSWRFKRIQKWFNHRIKPVDFNSQVLPASISDGHISQLNTDAAESCIFGSANTFDFLDEGWWQGVLPDWTGTTFD